MIVDDSMFMRKVLRDILAKAGHDVVAESDGAPEGTLREIARNRPDLVTLDLVMPGEGGMGILRRLRASERPPRVVVVSAVGQDAERRAAMELGATSYLVKPFDEKSVVRAISDAVV